jgi:type II secretory pathway predicted ATPase ExeA
MYLQRLGLRVLPFRLSPDAAFYYPSHGHAAARAALARVVVGPSGLTVLTGANGVGKTILLQWLRQQLPADVAVAHFNQAPPTVHDLYQGVLFQWGRRSAATAVSGLREALDARLGESRGARALITLDNAHACAPAVVAALTHGLFTHPHLDIVLVGEPALETALAHHAPDIAHRTTACAVGPLQAEEIAPYLQHRVDLAGATGRRLFDPTATDMLLRVTDGVPKQIHRFADGAVTAAIEDLREVVTAEDVLSAARLLGTIDATQQRHRSSAGAPVVARADRPEGSTGESVLSERIDERRVEPVVTAPARVEPLAAQPDAVATAAHATAETPPDTDERHRGPGPLSTTGPAEENVATTPDRVPETESAADLEAVYRLHVQHHGAIVCTVELGTGVLRIGRSSQNHLQIESRYISRRHCTITRHGSQILIEDLDSTNGVYLRGEPIWREPLQHGDVVQIGLHELRLDVVHPAGEISQSRPP